MGGQFILVGVKGLKPSTSRSQTERAINCATPRRRNASFLFANKCIRLLHFMDDSSLQTFKQQAWFESLGRSAFSQNSRNYSAKQIIFPVLYGKMRLINYVYQYL